MAKSMGDRDLKRFKDLEASQGPWNSLYDEAYKYTRPERDTTHGNSAQDERIHLYDSTAVDSSMKLANRLQDNLVPVGLRWAKFVPGSEVPATQKDAILQLLHIVNIRFFQLIAKTNFDVVSNENMQDVAVGQCGLIINPTQDVNRPAQFTAVPANQLVVGEGPDGSVQLVGRRPHPVVSNIKGEWPGITLDADLAQILRDKPEDKVELIEFCYPSPIGIFIYKVWNAKTSNLLLKTTDTSNPWTVARWSKRPGDAPGFGPIIEALADIKSLNKAVEMILQNASIELAGIYTVTDDGITNPDMIEIAPGVIIPVASNGGTLGPSIDALPRATNFDLSQIALNDLRQSIRRKLLDDVLAPLDDAVRAAEEVRLRERMFARETGPSFGRLQREYVRNIVNRLLDIWGKMGLLPPIQIDGEFIDIEYQTPLAQIQNDIELEKLGRSIVQMESFAPGSAKLALKTGETLAFFHEKSGANPDLIHSPEKIEELVAQLTEAALQDPAGAGQVVQALTQ